MTSKQILDLPMQDNDAGAATVRGYFISLLLELWAEQEGFSGKRPFGDSGWEFDLYQPLIFAGLVEGKVEDGVVEEIRSDARKEADRLIHEAIKQLGVTFS